MVWFLESIVWFLESMEWFQKSTVRFPNFLYVSWSVPKKFSLVPKKESPVTKKHGKFPKKHSLVTKKHGPVPKTPKTKPFLTCDQNEKKNIC